MKVQDILFVAVLLFLLLIFFSFFVGLLFFVAQGRGRCKVRSKHHTLPGDNCALEAIPEMRTAFFSILAPGKIIPPHRGPYKGLVRCHLALKIPEGDCGVLVSGQSRTWINGKCLFFDDTLIHEAWNKTNEERVVLFLDILRPLKKPYGKWNDRMIYWIASSYYGKKSIRTFSDWYARHGIRNDVVI